MDGVALAIIFRSDSQCASTSCSLKVDLTKYCSLQVQHACHLHENAEHGERCSGAALAGEVAKIRQAGALTELPRPLVSRTQKLSVSQDLSRDDIVAVVRRYVMASRWIPWAVERRH